MGQPRILGICGAPGTGKTTLAGWLTRKLAAAQRNAELLPELARMLTERGVHIDGAMREADYDAFLAAYEERDRSVLAPLAIADRTPVDHCSYLLVNQNIAPEFLQRHQEIALAALLRYRVMLYLPIQFPIKDNGFRETSPEYQRALDTAITGMLERVDVPIIEIRGNKTNGSVFYWRRWNDTGRSCLSDKPVLEPVNTVSAAKKQQTDRQFTKWKLGLFGKFLGSLSNHLLNYPV